MPTICSPCSPYFCWISFRIGRYWLLMGHWQLRSTRATSFLSLKSASAISLPAGSGSTRLKTRRPRAESFAELLLDDGVCAAAGVVVVFDASSAEVAAHPQNVPATARRQPRPMPQMEIRKRLIRSFLWKSCADRLARDYSRYTP